MIDDLWQTWDIHCHFRVGTIYSREWKPCRRNDFRDFDPSNARTVVGVLNLSPPVPSPLSMQTKPTALPVLGLTTLAQQPPSAQFYLTSGGNTSDIRYRPHHLQPQCHSKRLYLSSPLPTLTLTALGEKEDRIPASAGA